MLGEEEAGQIPEIGPPVGRILRGPKVIYTPCIISKTVNMMDFAPMIRLYYIIQLTFRKKDYLSRSDLIT